MQKKSSKKRKLSKELQEWLKKFIEEEVRHGTPKKVAKQWAFETVDNSVASLHNVQ
jgi:hypothetical protein